MIGGVNQVKPHSVTLFYFMHDFMIHQMGMENLEGSMFILIWSSENDVYRIKGKYIPDVGSIHLALK